LFFAVLLSGVGLSIFYLYRYGGVPREKRLFWVVFLAVFSLFAVPLFWYSQIARAPRQDESTANL
jgi:hypothetical protein